MEEVLRRPLQTTGSCGRCALCTALGRARVRGVTTTMLVRLIDVRLAVRARASVVSYLPSYRPQPRFSCRATGPRRMPAAALVAGLHGVRGAPATTPAGGAWHRRRSAARVGEGGRWARRAWRGPATRPAHRGSPRVPRRRQPPLSRGRAGCSPRCRGPRASTTPAGGTRRPRAGRGSTDPCRSRHRRAAGARRSDRSRPGRRRCPPRGTTRPRVRPGPATGPATAPRSRPG